MRGDNKIDEVSAVTVQTVEYISDKNEQNV